ncbi:FCD domain-containing protein [Micromonospora sp. DR5-3]|uniref:FadR/GntR family transcriptional regulator n=1 Tax=unclassified Micromonospora TaxID=2617518 RepID=UPI0011D6EEC9|nr:MULTISPECIES: FCD domain-containing protein [unclassified Micromonospora]MCW3816406.1 FCD domain-containing protein [Micromonospora sp. DR5-3]TYC21536.1 FadR family transcriptional regulator [Micromonospora sp. MP36]
MSAHTPTPDRADRATRHRPARRRGVHGEVVEIIGHRIVSGALPEGATLNVNALEQELDVSLTVVREALKVLGAKGLVDARQKRGTFVQPRRYWHLLDADVIRWRFVDGVDHRFLAQLDEVREIIEPAAARLAAERRTDTDLEHLDVALQAMAAADAPEHVVSADLAFHRALLVAAHNDLLEQMEVVLEAGLAQRDRIVHAAGHIDDPIPSHAAVVAGVRDGDPDAAERAVRALLNKARVDSHRAMATRETRRED